METSELINNFKIEISNSLSYLYVSSIMSELHQAQDDITDLYENNAAILTELDSLELKDYITTLDITMIPSVEMMLNELSPDDYVSQANSITNQISDTYKTAYQEEYDRISTQLNEISEKISVYSSWDTQLEEFKKNTSDYYNILNGYCIDLDKSFQYLTSYKGSIDNWHSALNTYKDSIDSYRSKTDSINSAIKEWYESLDSYKKSLLVDLNREIDSRNSSITDANNKIADFNGQIDSLNNEIDELNIAIDDINEVVTEVNDIIVSTNEALAIETEEIEKALSEAEEKLESCETERKNLQDLLSEYSEGMTTLLNDYNDAKEDYDIALNDYIEINDRYLNESLTDQSVITQEKIDDIGEYKIKLDDCASSLNEVYDKIIDFNNSFNSINTEIPVNGDVTPTPDDGNNGEITPIPPDNLPSQEPTPTLETLKLTPIPTITVYPNVNNIEEIDRIRDEKYAVPTCAIKSVDIPTFSYEAEESRITSANGKKLRYNTSENPTCEYLDRVPFGQKYISVSIMENKEIEVNTWFKNNSPQDIGSLLNYVSNYNTLTGELNPTEYLSVTGNSYAYKLNSILAEYGALNSTIASDFLNNQSQNVAALNDAYSSYRSYVGTLKDDVEVAFENENEGFTAAVDTCVTNIDEINHNNNELLGDFSTRMPNSRNGSDINADLVDVMIDPIQLVNSSILLESQGTSFEQAKSTLMIVGVSAFSIGFILLVIAKITDKRKRVK